MSAAIDRQIHERLIAPLSIGDYIIREGAYAADKVVGFGKGSGVAWVVVMDSIGEVIATTPFNCKNLDGSVIVWPS